MAEVTIDMIKELRARTGISMGACKKALVEAGGDIDKAIEHLRKKGEAKAAERSDRTTGEGAVVVVGDSSKKAMVLLACETDFVARSDEFLSAAKGFAQKVLAEGQDVDLSGAVTDLGIQLGEKIELKEKALIEGDVLGEYIHSNGKIGVVIALNGGSEELAREVAMHSAAMNPFCISPDEISDEVVAKEKEIWTEQLKNEGKPENIMENILAGKEKKFREAGALISQAFVKNPEQTIAEMLGDAEVHAMVSFRI
jgi:elongation factor Ts